MKTRLVSLAALALMAAACSNVGEESSDQTETLKEGSARALAAIAFVNDPTTDAAALRTAKVASKTAKAIVAHRDGADGVARTADDDPFDSVAELDLVSGVGGATLTRIASGAEKQGYLAAEEEKERDVIFSPQPIESTHTAEVAKLIGGAERSIDVAMYSFSDANVQAALGEAVKRGVKVRFLFDTGSEDRKLTGSALAGSKSGKLEALGVDVRWVNKIMHHKFMIVDGPRDDLAAADLATLVTGSANWSNGAATKYDENTLFLHAYPKLNLEFQREFDHLWEHSKDVVANPALVTETSTVEVTDEDLPVFPGMEVFFTSDNFKVTDTTFSTIGTDHVADQLVASISGAKKRIRIASGHLRLRAVADALKAKKAEIPGIDIQVYLDGQEYISESGDTTQRADQQACIAAATTDAKKEACLDKDFLYSLDVARGGVELRFKYYAYRWDTSYALQMHNKFMIVDDELWTGSFNLSDNAEHNTFENMLHFRGPEFADLVESYDAKFAELWKQGDGLLPGLTKTIDEATTIPIVFEPMSLSWEEVRDLKALIARECPAVNSTEFRQSAATHKSCTK
jgi:phosphatidylserine/phosphatidylglycerophosphate/cardiolipin synthase-like enzyme